MDFCFISFSSSMPILRAKCCFFCICFFVSFFTNCSKITVTFTTCLREHPSENHAILNYESTSALSDFVQILCRVT